MDPQPIDEKAAACRRLAEKRLAESVREMQSMADGADSVRIMHELLVHQVELEMQNEELMEARTELEANNKRFTELYDFAPVGYFSISVNGLIRHLNLIGARMLGRGRDSLLESNFEDFVFRGSQQQFKSFLSRVFMGENAPPCEVQITGHGESVLVLRLTGVLSPNGLVCRMAAMDVTDQRKAEMAAREKNDDLNLIFNISPDLIGIASFSWRFVRINPAFERMLGYSLDELTGRDFADFVHPDDRGVMDYAMLEIKSGREIIDFAIRYRCMDGSYRWLEWRAAPFRGGLICILGRDISERVKAEEELKRIQDELELRVQRRTALLQERTLQLRALASELTQAEERERRRIAGLIHDDLQQTLVAASLSVRMLKSTIADEQIASELVEITTMLADSIAISRSLTSELSPSVLQQFGLAAAFKWLRTWCMDKYGLEVELHVDEDLEPGLEVGVILFRAVRELLFNIVKHSSVKSSCLRMTRTQDGGAKIEVTDHGVGFDPVEARAREGTAGGFGLFNIRERLELLGGWFEIESSPGLGSRFTMWVPLAVNSSSPSDERLELAMIKEGVDTSHEKVASNCVKQSGKITIVIADDHAAIRENLVRLFQSEPDLEVVAKAVDGEQALQLARLLHPDFVVMDINMPRMDGIEATAAIRKLLPCVQVLGLSTYADDDYRSAMIRAGAVDLLHKNKPTSDIVAVLRSHAATGNCPCHTGNGGRFCDLAGNPSGG